MEGNGSCRTCVGLLCLREAHVCAHVSGSLVSTGEEAPTAQPITTASRWHLQIPGLPLTKHESRLCWRKAKKSNK